MSGLTLYCDGAVDVTALTCSTGWQSVVANPPFDISQLDPAALASAFGYGFFLFVGVWAVCKGCELVLSMLK
jgi:hypothetical protein